MIAEYGGYREYFLPDWTPGDREASSYMSGDPGGKLMNTHLHLLEALTTFYRATTLPLGRERLLELINIQSNTVVRKSIGACTDKYAATGRRGSMARTRASPYGHDLENIWLLIDACEAAGISYRPFLDLFRTLFDYSLKYGYDAKNGGFYDSGRFNQPADRLVKVWWTEAEAIVSALYMHRLTGGAEVFHRLPADTRSDREAFCRLGEWRMARDARSRMERSAATRRSRGRRDTTTAGQWSSRIQLLKLMINVTTARVGRSLLPGTKLCDQASAWFVQDGRVFH
jgi:mannose/cellobiose epimerase-like protein (N-acyl-D-glucosamine 2-epimerase family)